jgi:hypothetical protein
MGDEWGGREEDDDDERERERREEHAAREGNDETGGKNTFVVLPFSALPDFHSKKQTSLLPPPLLYALRPRQFPHSPHKLTRRQDLRTAIRNPPRRFSSLSSRSSLSLRSSSRKSTPSRARYRTRNVLPQVPVLDETSTPNDENDRVLVSPPSPPLRRSGRPRAPSSRPGVKEEVVIRILQRLRRRRSRVHEGFDEPSDGKVFASGKEVLDVTDEVVEAADGDAGVAEAVGELFGKGGRSRVESSRSEEGKKGEREGGKGKSATSRRKEKKRDAPCSTNSRNHPSSPSQPPASRSVEPASHRGSTSSLRLEGCITAFSRQCCFSWNRQS